MRGVQGSGRVQSRPRAASRRKALTGSSLTLTKPSEAGLFQKKEIGEAVSPNRLSKVRSNVCCSRPFTNRLSEGRGRYCAGAFRRNVGPTSVFHFEKLLLIHSKALGNEFLGYPTLAGLHALDDGLVLFRREVFSPR